MSSQKYSLTTYLANIAFESYRISANGQTYDGKPIPEWNELDNQTKLHWESAIDAIRLFFVSDLALTTRELTKITHALSYETYFKNAYNSSHHDIILIAKLALALGFKLKNITKLELPLGVRINEFDNSVHVDGLSTDKPDISY